MKHLREIRQLIQHAHSAHKYLLMQLKMYVRVRKIKIQAKQHDAEAQAILGALFAAGVGVTTDNCEALKWYLRAAKNGNTSAQVIVGTRYAIGKGVTKSYELAFRWYLEAARKNHKRAKIALCFMQMQERQEPNNKHSNDF